MTAPVVASERFRRSTLAPSSPPTDATGALTAAGDVEPATRRMTGRERLATVLTAAPALLTVAWMSVSAEHRPMTMDESFTVLTTRSWWALLRGIRTDPGMAVYYGALRLWSLVAGSALSHLRWFSALAMGLAVVGGAVLSQRRGRPGLGMLAMLGLALSPMAREAVVDARAAALGTAAAIWLLVACDRWLGEPGSAQRHARSLLVGSLIAAFTHPSTMFVGVAGVVIVWRRTRVAADPVQRLDHRLSWGAGAVLLLGTAMASVQSSSSPARAGIRGIGDVLGQLPGGGMLAGAALIAAATLLLAGRSFDDVRVIRWFGGAALLWFAAALLALPVRSVFVPRYFLAAAALVLLGISLARVEAWSAPLIVATLALAVVGGAAQLGHEVGFGSTWCAASEGLAGQVHSGDRVVFASSAYASPVVACLGGRADAVFAGVTTAPAVGRVLHDPRALWQAARPTAADLTFVEHGHATVFVLDARSDAGVADAVRRLPELGAECTGTSYGSVVIARCGA